MAEWETILFIGGPADGHNLIIAPGSIEYAVAKPGRMDMSFEGFYSVAPPQVKLHYVLYHRMKILGRGKEHALMVRGGMTADEVLERLMLYYRPPELDKETDSP